MEAFEVVTSQTCGALRVIDASAGKADRFVRICGGWAAFESATAQVIIGIALLTLIDEADGSDCLPFINDWIATQSSAASLGEVAFLADLHDFRRNRCIGFRLIDF